MGRGHGQRADPGPVKHTSSAVPRVGPSSMFSAATGEIIGIYPNHSRAIKFIQRYWDRACSLIPYQYLRASFRGCYQN